MQWKDLARRLIDLIEAKRQFGDEIAVVRIGDTLYELDIYRSTETGRRHIGVKYAGVEMPPEHIEDAVEASIVPEEHGPIGPKSDWLERIGKGKE